MNLGFNCEECAIKGKKIAVIALLAGIGIGAGVLFFVKRNA